MASTEGERGEEFISSLDRVRSEIKHKFQEAHIILQNRESQLLAELQTLADEYTSDRIPQQIKQLSDTISEIYTSLKGNENNDILQQSIAPIHSRINDLKAKLQKLNNYKNVTLEWDNELYTKLRVAGDLQLNTAGTRDYRGIGDPVVVFGKHSEDNPAAGVFRYPVGIAVNPDTNFIYICDQGNNRVQVYNPSHKYVFQFNKMMEGPYGICIRQNRVYVVQSVSNSLTVCTTEGNSFKSVGKRGIGELEFDKPRGLDVSTEKDRIYIAEFDNNRVQCLNLDLTFNSFINDIYGARDVTLTTGHIIVLSLRNPCVSMYTYSLQLIREIIPRGEGSPVVTPCFLSVDGSFNILISDFTHHCIYIFSFEGELMHKFGQKGNNYGHFIDPRGIAIDEEGRILVASKNSLNCIQVF